MRDEMAMTKNVRRFLAAVRELNDRPMGVEGMAILWGEPGEGKSTTVAFACNTLDGIFLRANTCWTPTSMLSALMVELGLATGSRRAPMVEAAVKRLAERPRPIFIDEADYLFRTPDMLDVMRDIYDVTGAPVVLIGMEDFARKVQAKGKFARRITQWVEFSGIDDEDARTLADTLCDVKVADDLMAHVHQAARKNIGRMVTGLARIEQFGRLNALETVTRKAWANRALFYDQPRFARRAS
jgi:DNA transposition AAA+ family ATPase